MNIRTRRWTAAIGALALFALSGCAGLHADSPAEERDTVFATVNGEPLRVGELRMMMNRTRSETVARFQAKTDAAGDAGFWTGSIDGEVPLEVWKQAALKALVRVKVEQAAAVREGLLADAGYDAFTERLEQENRERADAVAHGRIVYGPTAFTEDAYYDYVLTNTRQRLIEKLADNRLSISEADVRAYYEKRKDEIYRLEDRVTVGKIVISYVDQEGWVSSELREEAERRIREAAARLEQGESFAELSREYSTGPESADGGVQTFSRETASADQRHNPMLAEAARELQPGETSGVLEFNNAFYLLQGLERTDGGTRTYEDAKEDARNRLMEDRYVEWVEAEVDRADVRIEQEIWDRIGVDES